MLLEYKMVQKQRSKTREEFIIRIGPQLMEIIKEQMKSIKNVTYGVVKDSPWEAGEIIAMKFKGKI
jgi:hypothetical protein